MSSSLFVFFSHPLPNAQKETGGVGVRPKTPLSSFLRFLRRERKRERRKEGRGPTHGDKLNFGGGKEGKVGAEAVAFFPSHRPTTERQKSALGDAPLFSGGVILLVFFYWHWFFSCRKRRRCLYSPTFSVKEEKEKTAHISLANITHNNGQIPPVARQHYS